jgi:hypothetical protein
MPISEAAKSVIDSPAPLSPLFNIGDQVYHIFSPSELCFSSKRSGPNYIVSKIETRKFSSISEFYNNPTGYATKNFNSQLSNLPEKRIVPSRSTGLSTKSSLQLPPKTNLDNMNPFMSKFLHLYATTYLHQKQQYVIFLYKNRK